MEAHSIEPLPANYTVGIVGVGRLGGTLALHFARQHRLLWLVTHTPLPAVLQSFPTYATIAAIEQYPDCWFLTVQDSRIAACVQEISQHHLEVKGKIFIHCSGTFDLSLLAPIAELGNFPAVLHPYQMFPFSNPKFLHGISWSIESHPSLRPALERLVSDLGGNPVFLNEQQRQQKPIYHAAAVAAANAVIASIGLAQQLLSYCQLPAEQMLPPIVRTAVDTALEQVAAQNPILEQLTGPIVRGDLETLRQHLAALQDIPALRDAYAHLTGCLLHTARHSRLISDQQFRQMLLVVQSALQ